ncbi:MAG: hypothetical protein ACI9XO_003421 [Paraglaciecola sp.]|jgi:hypothetical protein
MISFTAEAIMLALHSSIRLSAQLRKVYANTLKTRALVLPLPKFNDSIRLTTAENFFNTEGAKFCKMVKHLEQLHDLVGRESEEELSDEIKDDYLTYYNAYWQVLNGKLEGISADDLSHLFTIRQWETGKEPITSPLQVVAGTLIEIGIDFLNQIPGAVHPNSVVGKFLKSFLSGIDQVDFAEAGALKTTLIKEIVPQLFIASAETINKLSDEITDDPKLQSFVQNISFGLTTDMQQRIENLPTDGDQQEVIRWGQLIFRSMVRNSTQYIFTQPNEVLGTGIKETELVKAVGDALMSVMLDKDPNSPIHFKEVFTMDSLDKVVKSALIVVAEYPSLLTNQNGLKEIISGVAASLAQSGINRPALLPELVQLVMLQTAGNLDRLFNTKAGETKHLLVAALSPILTTLAPKDIHAKWQPNLTNTEILGIVNNVFDEVVANPQWLESKVNGDTLLGEVIHATYSVLENIPSGNRLTGNTLQKLIQINLRTAAANGKILSKVKWGNGKQENTILNHALDLIFAFTFEKTDLLNKVDLMFGLTDYVMTVILSKHPNSNGLLLTQFILQEHAGVVQNNGFDKETADLLVKAALRVISERPDLVSDHEGLGNIVSGVAGAFKESGLKRPNLLPELLRITLENSAGNLDLLIPSQVGEPRHLMVVALHEILNSVSQPVPDGKWKPTYSNSELLILVETLLDEVVHNPGWITQKIADKPLLSEVLNANFSALQALPQTQRLNPTVLQMMFELSLHTAATNSTVLSLIRWGTGQEETTILKKALDLILGHVFTDNSSGDRSVLLLDLVDYVLNILIAKYPNETGLTLTMVILSDEIGLLLTNGGLDRTKANELVNTALATITQHPELISENLGIQDIVTGVAGALKDTKLPLSDMLPEFVRLTLEKTGGNLDLLVDSRKRKQKFILILALQQTLKAISQRPSSGKWKPTLTGPQIHDITGLIFDQILQNPHLVKNDFVLILMRGVFKALEPVPNNKPIPYIILKSMIEDAFAAVNFRKDLVIQLINTDGNTRNIAINYSLNGLFIALYDTNGGTVGSWTLTQGPILEAIVNAFLTRISTKAVNKTEIDAAIALVKKAMKDLNENKEFVLEELLEALI